MDYALKDLLDIPRLQQLLNSLDEIQSMPSAIIDKEGNVLTATAWQDICVKFHRVNPQTETKCVESDRQFNTKAAGMRPYTLCVCPMGLVDSASPIVIEGRHVGNVFTGQLFLEPPDEAWFRDQARRYGFEEGPYLEAVRKVPIFTKKQLHRNLKLIHSLAQMLAEQGLQHKRQLEAWDALHHSIEGRKTAERQLEESEKNYRNISELTSDFVYRCTRNGDGPFRIQWAGGGLKAITGYSAEEILAAGCWMPFVHPDDRDRVTAHLRQLVAGDKKTIDFRLVTKQGETRWISEVSKCLAGEREGELVLFGASRDTTERREFEQTLQMIRVSVDAASDAIYWIESDARILDANPAACRSLDYIRDELIQLSIPDLDPNFDMDKWSAHFNEVRERGTMVFESLHRRRDGEEIPVEIVVNHVRFGDRELNCAFARDITERKQAEQERLHLERQLQHAQKLESLGVLAGGIAHDFNNILTSIIGNADLAVMRLNPASPALENLHRIEQAAGRAADLARQMLAYSGKGRFVVEAIDLNRLVEEMGNMLSVSISKKAVLRYDLASPLPGVNADATQIRQVIMNLVINASEAIGERSGIIAIRTGTQHCNGKYLRGTWTSDEIQEGHYVFLEIADSGCGMDADTLGRIFDPFFTTKFTGRGLGMAAVMGIVRGHKGAITVYSEPGKGSTFKVLLPALERPAELSPSDGRIDGWRGNGKVLLVDDEETVRTICSEMLVELGFTALTANDGRQALEVYRSNPDICFVILDLTMPRMDGEQCYRELRQIDPKVKVVMSSGFNEQEVIQKFAGKGVAGFIQKPYKLSELREALKAIPACDPL